LFNVFINDITKNFENNKSTPLKLIDSNIGCLLFADDLLILSETKERLQHSIDNLYNYCDNWRLAIDVNKTKSMIFKQNYTKTEPSFVYYRNNQIWNVSEYIFLGISLKSNGNLSHSTTDLVKKAKKTLFCTYTTSLNNLPVKVANNLFDSLVKPIMTYNSEVTYLDTFISLYRAKKRASTNDKEVDLFNFIDKTPIENLHLSFCKYVLGIRKKASNLAVRLELGRLPVENFIKSQTLLYFARLYTTKLNPLLKESFLLCQNLHMLYICKEYY
jgi:hypothetical protein